MSDQDPIVFRPRVVPGHSGAAGGEAVGSGQHSVTSPQTTVAFNRAELGAILNLYGRKVASGEWRDYAMDFGRDMATFSVYRRSSEYALYTIRKTPRLARKQGAYSVVAANGLILKRGNDLARVLDVLDKRMRLLQH